MRWPELIEGELVKRYKRFLVDVRLADGELLTAHCPNTGAMTGCAQPGSRVWLSSSDNNKRKYPQTWELALTVDGYWIGIHSAKANALVKEALEHGVISELLPYKQLKTEVVCGDERSRIDLWLEDEDGQQCFIEVKSVTLLVDAATGLGLFPDAVSERASKHLRELISVKQQGHRAVLLFCVQHSGIKSVAPADAIDKRYGETFREAMAAGVEVLAYGAEINSCEIKLNQRLDVMDRQTL